MRTIRIIISAAAFVVTLTLAATAQTPPAAQAPKAPRADITGQWTSTFETMVGAQSGTITSADEIKVTRQVGEFATEQLVVKRVKKQSAYVVPGREEVKNLWQTAPSGGKDRKH